MAYCYKVRNDLSVASLTKIIHELEAITGERIQVHVTGINDVRLTFGVPATKGEMEEIRAAMTEMPPHYLKTLELKQGVYYCDRSGDR